MNRAQLEHVIRAAAAITQESPIVVVGSQSILGRYPQAPSPLNVSMEADLSPLNAPEKADLISGSIGEITLSQATYGYYAHGLPPDACPLPDGWRERLVAIQNENTLGYVGLCLHPDDLACSKLAAGRPKDIEFVRAMFGEKMIEEHRIQSLIAVLPAKFQGPARRSLTIVRAAAPSQ